VQADGRILVGGSFGTLGGQTRNGVGRLSNTEPPTESLTFDSSTVTWLRGGTAPEVWRTTFDACTDGTNWISLGAGTRIPGGWQQTGLSLPTSATIRARGFCTSGQYNGSGWFVETLSGAPFITCQPTNVVNFTNTVMGFTLGVVGTPPLVYQWYKNGAVVPGATNSAFTIPNSAFSDAGIYQAVVSNTLGAVTSAVATLTVVQQPLPDSLNPGANGSVFTCAPQPDGKIVLAGAFTTLGGQSRSYIGRLNADGGLDAGFNPGANTNVYALAVQTDGGILVGGNFTTLGGTNRNYVGRLDANGNLDPGFNPGASGPVYSLVVQPDGKILVGGSFTNLGGQARNYVGRINADGSLDANFNPGASRTVYSLTAQADGKILVGGDFTTLGGTNRNFLGRLNADGSIDTTFNPGANGIVNCLVEQPDGKILVGGSFMTLGGQAYSFIGRLSADGSLDPTFSPRATWSVYSLVLQADGKILLGGSFGVLGSQTRKNVGRLNPDGSLDITFNPGASGTVYSVGVQPDGRILVGGSFTTLGGQARTNIGRLNNTQAATETLAFNGSTVTWMRGGTGPEAWRTTFDASTNGTDWISLGAGERIAGGWQQTGLVMSANATIRAWGFCTGGEFNSSSWYVETGLGPVAISQQPISLTNSAGSVAQFAALGAGTPPRGYQWCKGGVPLSDGGNLSGAQTGSLTLTNVLCADTGGYSVIISNSSGSVTSLVATLTVVDPFISTQPVSKKVNAGTNILFSTAAAGTAPLTYQWLRNGLSLDGTTGTSLALTNVQWADAGSYSVVISNACTSVTSAVATLSVNGPFILLNDGNCSLSTNGFGFNVGCMPNQSVVIEVSSNLVDWVPVQTNVVTSAGIIVFLDPEAGSFRQRFYRVVPVQ
jgi:uncharacterized delta-60 repeat protein